MSDEGGSEWQPRSGRQTKYVVLEQRGRGEEREEGKREEELRA